MAVCPITFVLTTYYYISFSHFYKNSKKLFLCINHVNQMNAFLADSCK